MKGTMVERSPGTWWLRVYAGRNEKGQPVQVSRTIKGGKRAAQLALAKLVTEVEEKGASLSGTATVGEMLDRWLEYVTPLRQPTTIQGYVVNVRRLKATLGTVRLSKLTAQHLDKTYRAWLGRGLSAGTVRTSHGVLAAALHQAVRWGVIPKAATDLADPPQVSRDSQPATDPQIVRDLIEAAEERSTVLAAAIALAAITGCRRGELCGLRWSDVDLDRGVVSVERAVRHGLDHKELVVGTTKTRQRRTIALDPLSLVVLAKHRERAEGWAAQAEVDLDGDGYILSLDSTGREPLRPDTITGGFRLVAKHLGVRLRFHDLRHFTATQLIGAGTDVRTVAQRLGHADPSITLRIYASAIEERDRQAAAVMGALVAGPKLAPSGDVAEPTGAGPKRTRR